MEWFLYLLGVLGLLTLTLLGIVWRRLSSLSQGKADLSEDMDAMLESICKELDQQSRAGREELSGAIATFRAEVADNARKDRSSVEATLDRFKADNAKSLELFGSQMLGSSSQNAAHWNERLEALQRAFGEIQKTVDAKLRQLQEDNAAKLDKMRETVDEKLQTTLERRLGESFKLVSDRLEQVHKDLGEMHSIATGVGDLKRVLSNVKVRGVLGEMQLGALLEQLLSPDQYAANVKPDPLSNNIVEYAVKLPGREGQGGTPVWLPIDAKFPLEDYQALSMAYESADTEAISVHARALEARIRLFAKDLSSKYIQVPHTTDFALLFLPFEGLYAEILRVPGLFESIQREHKVNLVGPTTLSAFLSSLQMGFRTLAIEKRSSEVWEVLGAVKTEFGKFGGILEKTRKKLDEAARVIDEADVRNRAITKKLRLVDEMPPADSARILGTSEVLPQEGAELF